MMSANAGYVALQAKVWDGHLPLEIRLSPSDCRTYDQSDPYMVSAPRLSYLPLLLARLHTFFTPYLIDPSTTTNPYDGYFSYESVPMKWHLPVGLLYDIYCSSNNQNPPDTSTPLPIPPFRLTLHYSSPPSSPGSTTTPPPPLPLLSAPILHDSFINSVKEADFVRSGTAKPIMSLSAADSKALWTSILNHDLQLYKRIYSGLLPDRFRNIPLRIYIPTEHAPSSSLDDTTPSQTPPNTNNIKASIKILQSPIPPYLPASASTSSASPSPAPQRGNPSQPQTLGTALHTLLPSLFPSRRTPILARPMLHGAIVPMGAELESLARWAGYGDGWLGVVVVMI